MAPTSAAEAAALRPRAGALRHPRQPQRLSLDAQLSRPDTQSGSSLLSPLSLRAGVQRGWAGPATQLRSAPSGFRGAGPEGRSLGFGFLQTPRRQGNRGVSGNRTGSAEVRAVAGAGDRQASSAAGLWPLEVPAGAGENRPQKSPTRMHLPQPPPGWWSHRRGAGLGEGAVYAGAEGLRRQSESEEWGGPLKPPKSLVLPHTATCSFIVFISLIIAEIPFAYFVGNFSYMT